MSDDIFSKLPIRLHPTNEMIKYFVDRFVLEHPESFANLVALMNEQKDLLSPMNEFIDFLERNGFDEKYSKLEVFGGLRAAAISVKDKL